MADGVHYNKSKLFLTDEERVSVRTAVTNLLPPYLTRGTIDGCHAYTFATVLIPDERA